MHNYHIVKHKLSASRLSVVSRAAKQSRSCVKYNYNSEKWPNYNFKNLHL